jgi:hypothetical protein
LFYEDVKTRAGETVAELGADYGYARADWRKIWDDPRNALLASYRDPNKLEAGDVLEIPIPWKVTSRVLVAEPMGAGFTVDRDGRRGTRLQWVQTVNQGNLALAGTAQFCTDFCPPNDDLPFYWTERDLTDDPSLRTRFIDHPWRSPPPTVAAGTLHWRAILSIAVVSWIRVTVFNSIFWGFDMTPAGATATVGPRPATGAEVEGHLNLLRTGLGTSGTPFGRQGWKFRRAPSELGDFVVPTGDTKVA